MSMSIEFNGPEDNIEELAPAVLDCYLEKFHDGTHCEHKFFIALDYVTKFRKCIREKNTSECAICLEEIKKGSLKKVYHCNHSFHKKCALKWYKLNKTCPLCRIPVF